MKKLFLIINLVLPLLGLLWVTNVFLRPVDLIGTIFLVLLLFLASIAFITYTFFQKRMSDRVLNRYWILSQSIILILALSLFPSFKIYVPNLQTRIVIDFQPQVINTENGDLTYYLRIVNPSTVISGKYLVIENKNSEDEVPIEIEDKEALALASYFEHGKFGVLKSTLDPNKFLFETYNPTSNEKLKRVKNLIYEINLTSNTSRLINSEEISK